MLAAALKSLAGIMGAIASTVSTGAVPHYSFFKQCHKHLRMGGLGVRSVPPARQLHGLFWTHIPKTGTSLGTLLYQFGCPELPDDVAVPSRDALTEAQRDDLDWKGGKAMSMKMLLKMWVIS